MEILLIGSMLAIVCSFVAAWVAGEKGRPGREGAMLGFWLGPLGLLVEALLPTIEKPKPKPRKRMSRSGWQPPPDEDGFDQEAVNWLRDGESK